MATLTDNLINLSERHVLPTREIERHAAAKLAERDALNFGFDYCRRAFDVAAAHRASRYLVKAACRAIAGRVNAVPGKTHHPRRLLTKIQSLHELAGRVGNIDLHVAGAGFQFDTAA